MADKNGSNEELTRIRRENLKKGHQITADTAKEMQKKSVATKRKNRTIREILEEFCKTTVTTKTDEKVDRLTAMCIAQSNKAITGDTRAFLAVQDALGQSPVKKVAIANCRITPE